ncbi:MAG: DUF4215 domain-containing protein [Polyangiaceae bacterium]|nr:DUF4215 domain-containing protein [Polyangiaceae bacterium]
MREALPLVIVMLAIFIPSCNWLAAIEYATDGECAIAEECPVEVAECRKAIACDAGRCVYDDMLAGTLIPGQKLGDCVDVVCNGSGGKKVIPAPLDVENDGDPCTIDSCEGTLPKHVPGREIPCFSGPAELIGIGACRSGTLYCDAFGVPISGCLDEVAPRPETCLSPLDDDCDGEVNEEGEGCICTPGEVGECYTGAMGTAGTGECKKGLQACADSGSGFEECKGEVVPRDEVCDAAMIDEDCDGEVNEEGADCFCGDGYVSVGEECDDANQDNADACSSTCKAAVYGDGIVQSGLGETCDDGNVISTDFCTAQCQPAACGDGIVQIGERCDDGNTIDGDDCPSICSTPVVRVVMGEYHTCALLADGRVKCWGFNQRGQLGLGDVVDRGNAPNQMGENLPAVNLGAGKTAMDIAAGKSHNCAILNDGQVKCWGSNDCDSSSYGKLGLGEITLARGVNMGQMGDALPAVDLGTGRTAISIAAGHEHTCALLDDGSVKCWGCNPYGALGLGDEELRGDSPADMGDLLPAVDLGTAKVATAIAAGVARTCVLFADATLKCWGANYHGALGLGDKNHRGDGPNEMGNNLPTIDLGTGKHAIAVSGMYHSCAQLDDGSVKCWGYNDYGTLGLGDTWLRGDAPGEMGNALPAVDLGTGVTAVSLAGGYDHTCAVTSDGRVKCWGNGHSGGLGLGSTTSRGGLPGQMGNALPFVDLGSAKFAVGIAAGRNSTCVVFHDGRLKCWGRNTYGQLGLGDEANRGDEPTDMGDNLAHVPL